MAVLEALIPNWDYAARIPEEINVTGSPLYRHVLKV
jgi:hypothetical protein